MRNPTLEFAKLTHISEMLARNARFYVDITLQMSMEGTSSVREEQPELCCVGSPTCCVCLPLPYPGGLGRSEVECLLEFVCLSCRCRRKHTWNCSVRRRQTRKQIPGRREMDCTQINIHCSVSGSKHEKLVF